MLLSIVFILKAALMSHFIVTFKIHEDNEFRRRYDSVTTRLKALARWANWDETASFWAFECSGCAASLCRDLRLFTELDVTKDVLVVIDLDQREKRSEGVLYPDLLNASLGF